MIRRTTTELDISLDPSDELAKVELNALLTLISEHSSGFGIEWIQKDDFKFEVSIHTVSCP